VSRQTQAAFFQEQLRELALAIEQQRKEAIHGIVKALERAKKQLETKLKELAANEKKDDGLTFETLGLISSRSTRPVRKEPVLRLEDDADHRRAPDGVPAAPSTCSSRWHTSSASHGGWGLSCSPRTPQSATASRDVPMQRFLQMRDLEARTSPLRRLGRTFGEASRPWNWLQTARVSAARPLLQVRQCPELMPDVPAGGGHPDPGDAATAGTGPPRRQTHCDECRRVRRS